MKNKLTKEYLIIGAIIFAAIAGTYLFLYNPLIKNLNIKRSDCRSTEGLLLEMRDTIRLAGKATEDRVLLGEKEASLAIDELTKHGKAMGINFISITPKDIIKSPDSQYKILPVEMTIEASDHQFSLFLGLLDSLKDSVITVESFEAAPEKEKPDGLKATIVIDMYFSEPENQDAIVKSMGGTASPESVVGQAKRHAKRTHFSSWTRSPFIPKGAPGVTYSKLSLSGIIASGKEFKAMIGDSVVGKGDKIDGNTVVEVTQNKVVLNDGTKDFELKLAK